MQQPITPGLTFSLKLRRSIEELGHVEPIVWNDRTANIVNGHQPTWGQRLQVDNL